MRQLVAALSAVVLGLIMFSPQPALAQDVAKAEGLVEMPDAKADIAYIRPGVDWGKYKTFYVHSLAVTPEAQDATPDTLSMRSHLGESYVLADKDIDALGDLYLEETRKELERKGMFEVVDEPQADSLIVVAAIVDIYMTAPIERTRRMESARGGTVTPYAGSLTVSAALADGETGQVLARVLDRRYPHQMWRKNTRINNAHDARQIFQAWARQLRSRLDDFQSGKVEAP